MAVTEQTKSLSDYQCECANPNAATTPKTYKQGPVVRLDKDVREVQKWAGIEDSKGASMTRDTRTAMRDKIAEYQKQNGIQTQTPGELNKDTLDRMRQDKTLPQGLADSLEKVKPYYKPQDLPRVTCVTPPAQSGGAQPVTPKSLGLMDVDLPPARQAALQADMVEKAARMVQKKEGLPETGRMDDSTAAAMKGKPEYKALTPQIEKWKEAGLIDKEGKWDQKRDVEMRIEAWKVKPSASADKSGPAQDNPFAGKKFNGGEGLITKGPASTADPAPRTITGPARDTDSKPTFLKTSADGFMPQGKLNFEGSIQPSFTAARDHIGSQSMEVMARAPSVASGLTNKEPDQMSFQQRSNGPGLG